jgi:D-alanine-D-alanine ligase-like ATP-grasp enzyme
MSQLNTERAVVRILREAARDLGASVQSIGEGWILRFSRGGVTRFLHGYTLDLNTAATHAIACDKGATSDVLGAAGVAHVEHRVFLHPKMAAYVAHRGNWEPMLAYARGHGFDVVVKDNQGTGGRGVYRARNEVQLEHAVYRLFDQTQAVALSPYYEAPVEHRFIMLGGRCEAAYTKLRPTVVGDGRRTVLELLAERMIREGGAGPIARLIASMDEEMSAGLGEVLPAGGTRLLNWRHNLGQGATVRVLEPDSREAAPGLDLAVRAAGALNLAYGSVDVVETARGPLVMEVNAGLMMEFLARSVEGGEALARRVYRRAFEMMLE